VSAVLVSPNGTADTPAFSFELFPPKTEEMTAALWVAIERLATLSPRYFSVTCGAGGSTREGTHATVTRIQSEAGVPAAAHLTCAGASRAEIDAVAESYWDAGVRHVVALRGDMPATAGRRGAPYRPDPAGYAYAVDLVAGLKRLADFEISVAAYPETHPDAPSRRFDLDNLKRKIDAGATRAITQFFFDNDVYLRFVERARRAGITAPIVPGILPITNYARTVAFARRCGASIPRRLAALFDGLDGEPETRALVAASFAAEQCAALRRHGVDEFHFYTLNRAELVVAICRLLGVRPAVAATAA